MEQRRTPGVEPPGPPVDVFDEAWTARAVVDERGIVTGWSEGARLLLGYPPAEIIGEPAACLLIETVTAETLSGIRVLPRWSGRLRLRHRDGHQVEAGVLAHHRLEGGNGPDWFLVSALTGTAAVPEDELLLAWSFEQAPFCGFILYDTHLRMRRVNDTGQRVADFSEADMRGLRLSDFIADPAMDKLERNMVRVLETGEPRHVETYVRAPGESREHALETFLYPLRDENGAVRGVCMAGQDMTEQYWARKRMQLLNDAGARIGSTLDVTRTAQELADVTVPAFADFAAIDLLCDHDSALGTPSPDTPGTAAAGPLRLRRAAHQSVFPGTPEAVVPLAESDSPIMGLRAECLATGRGVLRAEYDPQAVDDVFLFLEDERRVAAVREFGIHSMIAVPLRARGDILGVAFFARHQRPEPFGKDDLMLAEEISARAAVYIDNARRYTRERNTSLALQRSLLPRGTPEQSALETATRYMPAGSRAGVGGDWYDVIPLSGARVALVVGDVVGHGLHATATMGRLRAAVRTLADIDLPPDELLTHLDDVVIRLRTEGDGAEEGSGNGAAADAGQVGATCLYMIYDPVSRRCTAACAGHPPPAVVCPGSDVEYIDIPAGPPLGVGGLPFEAVELQLPEGSLLALYTDGLIESARHDLDEGLECLRNALSAPMSSPEDMCDHVLNALVNDHPRDDIALIIARTQQLDGRHVATWDLSEDLSEVARARDLASRQLGAWGLEESAFVTELVVSELVTNAVRYGRDPIQLRLIRQEALICEVSDGSNTAPHLRRARIFDEGGRGLFIVAQIAECWGTRQRPTGKTIWAEIALQSSKSSAMAR
ncbi:SpoIIE family protein phosphatase [Streptomyces sp. NPDC002205]|uniref:SpoIIE family protein phosphatase n=1 Tax=Streptomyces sp. NPDC002205 TaxID=3154411 RepID=UPI003328C593